MIDKPDSSSNAITPRVLRPLEKGWVRYRLIRELAQMEKPQTVLAEEYGVTQGAISQFATRHASEVAEVKADIENEFAGLWIADKKQRIAEYAAEIELIDEARGGTVRNMRDVELSKLKAAVMRAVADELGQIPARMSVSVTQRVTYTIEGVDPEQLR
jgi:predicted transcriptional regulator